MRRSPRLYLHNVVIVKAIPALADADSLTELGSRQNEYLNEEWPVANEADLLTDRDLGQNEPLFISSILQKAVNVKSKH